MFLAHCESKENKTLVNSSRKKLCHIITSFEQMSRLLKFHRFDYDDFKFQNDVPIKEVEVVHGAVR